MNALALCLSVYYFFRSFQQASDRRPDASFLGRFVRYCDAIKPCGRCITQIIVFVEMVAVGRLQFVRVFSFARLAVRFFVGPPQNASDGE